MGPAERSLNSDSARGEGVARGAGGSLHPASCLDSGPTWPKIVLFFCYFKSPQRKIIEHGEIGNVLKYILALNSLVNLWTHYNPSNFYS